MKPADYPSAYVKIARAGALFAVVLGVTVLAGWALGSRLLQAGAPGLVPMKVNTAACFILLGASLGLHSARRPAPLALRVARGLACVAASIGVATLVESATGVDLRIDEALLWDPGDPVAPGPAGRMPLPASTGFALLGLALVLRPGPRTRGLREALYLATGAIGFAGVTGYLYGARSLHGWASYYTPMALSTSSTLVVLVVGALLERSDRGLASILASRHSGGAIARQLLPAAIGVPLAFHALLLLGYHAGAYDAEFGAVLFSMGAIAVLVSLVLGSASRLNQVDAQRRAVELEVVRAREEAQRQSTLLGSVVENIGDGVVVADTRGKFLLFNAAAEEVLGVGALDVDPKEWSREYAVFMPDGVTPYPADELPMARALRGESATDVELRVRRPQRDVWIRLTGRPVRAADGEVVAGVVALSDITAWKRSEAEIRALNSALAQRATDAENANRELESFSYSVSHDLRAPLRAIDGFGQALLQDCADRLDDVGREHLGRVRAAAQRMAQLIDALLALSRITRGALRREAVDLAELAREVAGELARSAPERSVVFEIPAHAPAHGDPRLLRAALENLLGNAWKFTTKRPHARIAFGVHEAEYFVRDDGEGFDMAHAGHLFGAFQRLHGRGEFEGTGIGLATVARIVARHGGRIWAEAEPGRGATFRFTLSGETRGGADA